MADKFYTILTSIGKNKLANSVVLGNKVNLKTLKVGDGNGAYYEPSENQTTLINKVWEGNINSISVDESNSNWIIIETIIPATDGGFFIREAGIFDEAGDLIAVSKISETYKPVISEGSTKDVAIKIVLEVSNVDSIELKIDPNVIVATKNDVQVLESKVLEVATQLSDMRQQQKTYVELAALVADKKLVPGTQYLLTDYKTKYIQPSTNAVKEMSAERLVLTAISSDKFAMECTSSDFPTDKIFYNFNSNVCEDKTTPRNGFILRRVDPINYIDFPLDWRKILWARYRPNPTQYKLGTAMVNYSAWTSGVAQLNVIYKIGNALYMAWNNTTVPTSATDPNVWRCIYDDITVGMLKGDILWLGRIGTQDLALVKDTLDERYTFGASCTRISVAMDSGFTSYYRDSKAYLVDSVFGDGCEIISAGMCFYGNTLGSQCQNLSFKDRNCYNTLMGYNSSSSFGANFDSNLIGKSSYGNNFEADCVSNALLVDCNKNSFGAGCVGNSLGVGCDVNMFGANCWNNTIGTNSDGNQMGTNCYQNVLGNACYSNLFANSCWGNVVKDSCFQINFGPGSYSNNFGIGCYNITFVNNGHDNTFGNSCSVMTCGSEFRNNSFGDMCTRNTFGSCCFSNAFGTGCNDNFFDSYTAGNTFGNNRSNLMVKYMRNRNISAIVELDGKNYTHTIESRADNVIVFWYLNSSNAPVYAIIP